MVENATRLLAGLKLLKLDGVVAVSDVKRPLLLLAGLKLLTQDQSSNDWIHVKRPLLLLAGLKLWLC